jgi:hypothetical protein
MRKLTKKRKEKEGKTGKPETKQGFSQRLPASLSRTPGKRSGITVS